MQALSSYQPEFHSRIGPVLRAIEDEAMGFKAESYCSQRGWFARFVWPDWPDSLSDHIHGRLDRLHQEHSELQPVKAGSEDWTAVFRDWRTDPESVAVISQAFCKYFGKDRVAWVQSERDGRGRIGGHCQINDLGEITLHLSWRDSMAVPLGALVESDRELFQQSTNQVFRWAEQRIKPVLDTLHERLKALYGERFRGLYVFGSYAQPDAGIELPEDSDLDVALILSDFENPYDEITRFSEITSELSLKHGLVISLVPIRERDYNEGRTNFIRVISEYAIPVK